MLATAMVYMDAMGAVARCCHCDDVLLTLVESEDRVWIGVRRGDGGRGREVARRFVVNRLRVRSAPSSSPSRS